MMIIFGIPLCDVTRSFCMEESGLSQTSLLHFNAKVRVLQIEKSCHVHFKLLNSTIHYEIS